MSPEFTLKNIPQKETLGEKLKRKRKSLGLEIHQVEKALKIRAKYLKALEDEEWIKLPPDPYTKGFLKSYALYLKLDPQKILSLFKREKGIEEGIRKASGKSPQVKQLKSPRVIITPKTLFIALILIGALAAIFYVGWQFKSFTAPPKLEVTSPADNTLLESDFVYIAGKTDAGADLFINNVSIGTDSEGKFKEKIILKEGINILQITATNKLKKETKITRNVLVKLKTAMTAPTTPSSPQKGIKIDLKIGPNPAWITIEADNGKTYQGIILAGVNQSFTAKENLKITSGNAGSTHLVLNNEKVLNKALGLMGKEGEVKTLEFKKDTSI